MGQRRFVIAVVVSLGLALVPAAVGSSISVRTQGFHCNFSGGALTAVYNTVDSTTFIESYAVGGKTLYSNTLVCQGVAGPGSKTHAEFGGKLCVNPEAKSVPGASSEVATFADTEVLFVCNTPDDDGASHSNADNVPLRYVNQGFPCTANVGSGVNGNTMLRVHTADSIEVDQTYSAYAGGTTRSTTTTCIGQLPKSVAAPNSDVAHQVTCTEPNPSGGPIIQAAGISATYTDGQYSQTCNVPNTQVPAAGTNVVAAPVTGTILIQAPGTKKFIRLRKGQQIPLGSTVDATHGRVQLTSARDKSGHTTTGVFYAGVFRITQVRSQGAEITVLTLAGPKPSGCSAAKGATVARRHPRRRKRILWGNSKGDFRTKGSYASATERGTRWLTQDTCAGTLIHVAQGVVTVDDLPHHRTLLLRAPGSFLAHPGKGG